MFAGTRWFHALNGSRSKGILGTVPIVGPLRVPLAVGAAMAYKMRVEPHVAVAFFGDGTIEEGHVHESLNLAALSSLCRFFSYVRTICTRATCTGASGG